MATKDEVRLAREIFVAEFDTDNIVGLGLATPLGSPDDWKLVVLLKAAPEEEDDLPDFIEQVEVKYTVVGSIKAFIDGATED